MVMRKGDDALRFALKRSIAGLSIRVSDVTAPIDKQCAGPGNPRPIRCRTVFRSPGRLHQYLPDPFLNFGTLGHGFYFDEKKPSKRAYIRYISRHCHRYMLSSLIDSRRHSPLSYAKVSLPTVSLLRRSTCKHGCSDSLRSPSRVSSWLRHIRGGPSGSLSGSPRRYRTRRDPQRGPLRLFHPNAPPVQSRSFRSGKPRNVPVQLGGHSQGPTRVRTIRTQ